MHVSNNNDRSDGKVGSLSHIWHPNESHVMSESMIYATEEPNEELYWSSKHRIIDFMADIVLFVVLNKINIFETIVWLQFKYF